MGCRWIPREDKRCCALAEKPACSPEACPLAALCGDAQYCREFESRIWVDTREGEGVIYLAEEQEGAEPALKPLFAKIGGSWRNVMPGGNPPFRLLEPEGAGSPLPAAPAPAEDQGERVLGGLDWEAHCASLLALAESYDLVHSLEEAYQGICAAVADILKCDETHLHFASIDETCFIKLAQYRNGESTYGWETNHPAIIGRMKWMLMMRKPVVLDYRHPHFSGKIPDHALSAGIVSGVNIPLLANGSVIGICSAIYRRKTAWADADAGFLMSMGRVLGATVKRLEEARKDKELAILDERMFLSGEIYDAVSTLIGSLSLQAAAANAAIDAGDIASAQRGLSRLEEIAVTTIGALRDEVHSLRLPLAEDDGFIDGVRDMLVRFERSWGIQTELDDSMLACCPIQLQASMQLMRILGECLSNTLQHANAEHVRVTLKGAGAGLELTYEDDGCGFDVEAVDPEKHGINIMQERALLAGGTLDISSGDEGTVVHVRVSGKSKLQRGGSAL